MSKHSTTAEEAPEEADMTGHNESESDARDKIKKMGILAGLQESWKDWTMLRIVSTGVKEP
jgi:hypothetical protein